MKRTLATLAAAAALLVSCAPKAEEPMVMARFVPERCDDFILENNLICGRFYGEALEGNPTSPGFDIWVKTPGALVANQRYVDELENGLSYHIDRGNGKDCYKVAVSLGGGSSSPLVNDTLRFPATNFRSWEILSETPEEIVFVLHYPAWDVNGVQVALDKKITVSANSYFFKAEDTYTGDFESLDIAAGFFDHGMTESSMTGVGRFAIWEEASDQSVEPEDGMIGVAIVMPEAEDIRPVPGDRNHIVGVKTIGSGESVTYWFGSCWSKGDVKTANDWFDIVNAE